MIDDLIEDLGSENEATRARAGAALRRESAHAIEPLLLAAIEPLPTEDVDLSSSLRVFAYMVLGGAIGAGVGAAFSARSAGFILGFFASGLLCAIAQEKHRGREAERRASWRDSWVRRRKEAEDLIAGLDDVTLLGPLINALPEKELDYPHARLVALKGMLGRLTPADRDVVNSAQVGKLLALLGSRMRNGDPWGMRMAILGGLAQIGERECLGPVRKIARMKARNGNSAGLKEAAEACVAAIEARLAGHWDRANLLRPADGSLDGALLRPAGAPTADGSALMRPAGGTPESGAP